MSVEGSNRQELPSADVGSKSNDASQIRPYPAISNSDSLEDGEIVEGRFSSISSWPLSQKWKDQPQLRSPNHIRASIPAFPTPEPAASVTSTVEHMTKEDLDRAKSLVLDLLGWGVTPEYLVECGLSPGVVYRIFTDLRLRLPCNLEVSSPPSPYYGAR